MALEHAQGPAPAKALPGTTVLVTRPRAQSESLCQRIQEAGGRPIRFPVIGIEPVQTSLPSISDIPDMLIYTSVNAVIYGVTLLTQPTFPVSCQVAAIGQATACALKSSGIDVDIVPDGEFTSEALLAHPQMNNVSGKKIMIVKGEGGRELLADSLGERGARVTHLDVYRRTVPNVNTDEVLQACADNCLDVILVTSTDGLTNLFALLGEQGRACLQGTPFIVISERIREACKPYKLTAPVYVSAGGSDEAILAALFSYVRK